MAQAWCGPTARGPMGIADDTWECVLDSFEDQEEEGRPPKSRLGPPTRSHLIMASTPF